MNDVLQTIKQRRAVRSYQSKLIEADKLELIVEAGLYAPNAGSRQSAIIAVSQNAEINAKIEALNAEAASKAFANRPAGHAVQSPTTDVKPSIFYGAPVVATIFAPKDWYNFTLDCAVTAENMLLAATSLGIGSNIIARAKETFETEYGAILKKQWGIPEDYEAKLHVILGYANEDPGEAKPRKDGRVIYV